MRRTSRQSLPADSQPPESASLTRDSAELSFFRHLDWALFLFALFVYVATRFIGLTKFPIFFFCDEALQGNLAEQLLQNGFRDHTGTFLPPYFLNDQRWAVSLSAYIHLITVWLFGKSVFVVRATSAAVTVLGVAATAVALRVVFRNRFWWAAPFLFAVMPVSFLHARTAFESVMMAGFYSCFLCLYLLYRYRSPLYIFPALLFGAATFYAYTAGQGVMLVSGVLLFFSDLRYHFRQKRTLLTGAALLAILLAFPYVRYRRLHPGVVGQQLEVLHSYWVEPIPLSEKLERFGRNYFDSLDPRYWFQPNETEMVRHRMKGMPYIPVAYLPFLALGLGTCLWKFRGSSAHRAILFSPLGVPFAGAAAGLQILRLLAIVVPVAFFVAIGMDRLYRWARRLLSYVPVAIACAGIFTIAAARLTQTALAQGPTWYSDYGLYGMQYGAPQVFRAIREELAESPKDRILLSHTWANNPNEFLPFFLSAEQRQRVSLEDIRGYIYWKRPLSADQLFVLTQNELETARRSGKFLLETPERTIPYPDGTPGFIFLRLRYVDNLDAVFAAERAERARLKEGSTLLDGEPVLIRHSQLDMGELSALFDRREQTLIRGFEANPFVLEMLFPKPRRIGSVRLMPGMVDLLSIRLRVMPQKGGKVRAYEATYQYRPQTRWFEFDFPEGPVSTSQLRIEIEQPSAGEITHIHLYEISLQ